MSKAVNKPKRIVAQPIRPLENKKMGNRQLWAIICFYYPQYNLTEASKLSIRTIRLLINTARREQARQMLSLTQISAAPHTKKGKGVNQLTEYFQGVIDS